MLRESVHRPFATRMSGVGRAWVRFGSRFARLARASLGLCLASMSTGCLIEDPPPYAEPQQTPPRLSLHRANPPIDQVIVTQPGDVVPINVPVASEDAGDPLWGTLFLDFDGQNAETAEQGYRMIAPSTLDEGERDWSRDWNVPTGLVGCHRLTLIITHRANLGDTITTWPPSDYQVLDAGDLAWAVWWVNSSPSDPDDLLGCPSARSAVN